MESILKLMYHQVIKTMCRALVQTEPLRRKAKTDWGGENGFSA